MKKSFKRILSVILSVIIMLTSASLSFTAFAAGEPVFALDRISESESRIVVCVKLVSGEFMAVDLKVTPKSRKVSTCESIEDADDFLNFGKEIKKNNGGVMATVFNPASTAYSAAVTSPYKKANGQIAIYTFVKTTSEVIAANDLELKVTSCNNSSGAVTPRTTNNLDTSGIFTVSFNANGGSTSTASKKVVVGSIYGALPTPTMNGYSFDGWYTAASGGTKVTRESKVALTANQTLYAHWSVKKITVTFNAGGGTVSPASKSVTFNSTYGDLPTPTKNGYSFDGWYTAASGGTRVTKDSKVTITANQTLYARWTAKTFTVTFSANGGKVTPASKAVTFDANYGDLPTPTKENYSFDGWYTTASGGTKVTKDSKVVLASNHTLYAHWTAKTFTVTFNANGGNISTPNKSVAYNMNYGDLPTPTRTGYVFGGWYTAASGGTKVTKDSKVTITANQTLYAHWDGLLGDVDKDGNINSSDALMILQHSVEQIKLTGEDIKRADVDRSGSVNSSDALIILQYATGQIKTF